MGAMTDYVNRTGPRVVRHYGTASPLPRSQDGACLPRLVRLQGDSKAAERRVAVEHPSWMLRGTCGQSRSRRA